MFPFKTMVPSGNLTQLWKITIFTRKIHYFHGHFQQLCQSLPEGRFLSYFVSPLSVQVSNISIYGARDLFWSRNFPHATRTFLVLLHIREPQAPLDFLVLTFHTFKMTNGFQKIFSNAKNLPCIIEQNLANKPNALSLHFWRIYILQLG